TLGRAHDAGRTAAAFADARAAGFDNVNLDLIYGTPGESEDDWRRSVEEAIALGPEHLSAYALTIETGTAFGAAVASGALRAPARGPGRRMSRPPAALLGGDRPFRSRGGHQPRPPRAGRTPRGRRTRRA